MSIRIDHIAKSFKGETVLDDVSLDVATGETLVLFGPSGAGKTVLLRLIAGVIDPDRGAIFLHGQDMSGVEPEDRGVGMAFQNFALFPHMDAFANIASPLVARRASPGELRRHVKDVAGLLKIEHVLSHMPRALSNGQKQRTALGRALAANPSILLLDDPLRNVDAKLRFEMRLELPRLLKGRNATVIHVTQDYREAMALGDRIAVMSGHKIVQTGTPADIYLRPATAWIARLFGDPVINMFDVIPEKAGDGGVTIECAGMRFSPGPGYAKVIGTQCVLGIRPEYFRFVEEPGARHIAVSIEAETPLNEKTITLAVTAQNQEILVSRPSAAPGPAQGTAFLAFNPADALLFERASGQRIGLENESAPAAAGRLHINGAQGARSS